MRTNIIAIAGVVVTVCILVYVAAGFYEPNVTYSAGFRDGYIQKFSQKGFFVKTWEGELSAMGRGAGHDADIFEHTWAFSVTDQKIVDELNALPVGVLVRLHYKQLWWYSTWRGQTPYRITSVTVRKS